MKTLPTFGKDTFITEDGHYLVRPLEDGDWLGYCVVNAVTDRVEVRVLEGDLDALTEAKRIATAFAKNSLGVAE